MSLYNLALYKPALRRIICLNAGFCGFLTSIAASYVFGRFTSHFIFPNNLVHIDYRPAFVVYTITDLILVFLIAFILSMATGRKNIWILMYIIGVVGWPLYSAIRSHIDMFQHDLPIFDTLIPSLAVLLIITPSVAWGGAVLGSVKKERKHNNAFNTDAG